MDSFESSLVSPPTTTSPPPVTADKQGSNRDGAGGREVEAIDANALTKALKDFAQEGRTRERTPTGSPSRKRQRVYGDRSAPSLPFNLRRM